MRIILYHARVLICVQTVCNVHSALCTRCDALCSIVCRGFNLVNRRFHYGWLSFCYRHLFQYYVLSVVFLYVLQLFRDVFKLQMNFAHGNWSHCWNDGFWHVVQHMMDGCVTLHCCMHHMRYWNVPWAVLNVVSKQRTTAVQSMVTCW